MTLYPLCFLSTICTYLIGYGKLFFGFVKVDWRGNFNNSTILKKISLQMYFRDEGLLGLARKVHVTSSDISSSWFELIFNQ